MPRFFAAGTSAAGGVIFLTGADADHVRVLRMKLGEHLVICDGSGTDRHCRITRIQNGQVEAEVCEVVPCPAEPSVDCRILAGMPKGERSDFIVQKCTEGGASEICFFVSERCIARPDPKGLDKKIQRWQRIAEEAAKQSGRGVIPQVSVVMSFAEALDRAVKTELPLFLYETGEGRMPIRQALEGAGDFRSAAIVTGPEGGFERFEADLAAAAGLRCCSMGERIFRCESAPFAALTAVMYATDNL